jgi:DNA-binding transcriptional MerR regulator
LLPRPQRRESGYRDYDEQALAALSLINRGRRLGYTLREIALYLDTPNEDGRTSLLLSCIEKKLAQFDQLIVDTRSRRASLQSLREGLRQAGAG